MALSLQKLTALAILLVTTCAYILVSAEADPRGHGIRFGYHKRRPRPPPVHFGDRWQTSRLPLRNQNDPYHPHYHRHFDRERSFPPEERDSHSFLERKDDVPDHNPGKVGTPRSELTPNFDFDSDYIIPSVSYPSVASSSPYYFNFPFAVPAYPQLPCGCVSCRCVVQHGNPEPQPPAIVIRSPINTQTHTFHLHPVHSDSRPHVSPLTLKQTINEYTWHSPGCKSSGDSLHGPLSQILQTNLPPVVIPVPVEGGNKQKIPLPSTVPVNPQEGGPVETLPGKTIQLHGTSKGETKGTGEADTVVVNVGGPVEPPSGKTVHWHDTSMEKAPAAAGDDKSIYELNEGGPVQPPPGKTIQWHDTSKEAAKTTGQLEAEVNVGGPVEPPPGTTVQWHDTSKEAAKTTGQHETVVVNVGGPVEPPVGTTVQWHDTSMEKAPTAAEDDESIYELNEGGPVEPPPGTTVQWHDTSKLSKDEAKATGQHETVVVNEGGPEEPPPGKTVHWHDTSMEKAPAAAEDDELIRELNEGGPVELPQGKLVRWEETLLGEEEEGGPVEPPPEKNIKWHDTSKTSNDKMKSADPIVNEGGPVEPPAGTQIKWHETGKNTSAAKMEAKKPIRKNNDKDTGESRSDSEDEKGDYFNDVDVI